jgi:acylphosphatase
VQGLDLLCRHLTVEGRVQGVGYRANAAAEAQVLGLSGWVRNLPDGRVEVVVEGPAEAVEAFERWCRRGPRMAVVTRVVARTEAPTGEDGFRVR